MNVAPERRASLTILALLALAALAWWALPIDLGRLLDAAALRASLDRLLGFAAQFARPDLSAAMLHDALGLALDTIAVALLGTALGLALALPLAVAATRHVVLADEPPHAARWRPGRLLRRGALEVARLSLDVLRGVPDFAWALLIANFTGPSPVTGVLAIGLSVAGILGKVFSEQWDAVDPQRYAALRSTGAGALATFAYGVLPLASRGLLSFVLMRTECAVRNASVIGVIGGGGLGAALGHEYQDQAWSRVATVLLFMLAVTVAADLAANVVRHRLRVDPNHPRAPRSLDVRTSSRRRATVVVGIAAAFAACAVRLWQPLGEAVESLARISPGYGVDWALALAVPDLRPPMLAIAAAESAVPLAIGLLATLGAVLLAAAAAFPASIAFQLEAGRFTGENAGATRRALRLAMLLCVRLAALVLRAIPEVAWAILLLILLQDGALAAVLAVLLHSAGVLLRVFVEAVDDVPYARLERTGGCRGQVFAYGALPSVAAHWKTYAFFQFESNVRIGIVLGMVGAGGLGDAFETAIKTFGDLPAASTFLWTMVLLTIAIDRTSRRLQLRRTRC